MALALEGWARGFDYDIDRMERVSKEALRLAEDDDHEARFFASLTLSFFLYAFHRVEEARPYLELAEKLAPLARNLFRQAWWGIVGWHQLNWEGRYDEVLDHLQHWKSPAEKSGSLFVVVGLRWEEAVALGGKGDYQRALSLAREVLATSERIGYDYFRIRAVNVVGWIYGELQDHERAAAWNRRGVEVAIEAAEVHPEVECNALTRDDLMALGRLDEADAEFRVVEAIVRSPRPEQRLDLWRFAQHLYHSYGALWLLRGDAKRAIELADECIAIAEPANHRKNVVKGRRLRGEAFLSIGDLESAESELTKALDIAKAVGNPPQLWKTFVAMGELRKRQGRTNEASACYREALAVIGRVADALEEDELRDTFLGSDHVQSIRARASA
jgi:tetratricopeptide (TPR) repeat protein